MHDVGTRTVAAATALIVLVGVVALAGREPLGREPAEPVAVDEAPDRVVVAPPARFPVPGALPPEVFVIEEDSPTPAWLPWAVAGAGVLGLVAVGLLLLRNLPVLRRRARRRTPASGAAEPSTAVTDDGAAVVRRAVEAALVPLHDPADPRAAVIAAYARLEQVLADRELGRRTPEAPREYLARVLREQGMPERSLTTLTALFEEARFSLHPIPDSAPRRALDELEQAHAALARTATPAE